MQSNVITTIAINIANATVIFSMIVALITGFFGYKLQRVFAALSGFAIGAVIGAIIAILVCPKNEYFLSILLLAAIGAGIGGAFLGFKFYKVGVFFYMFSTTFSLFYSLLEAIIERNPSSITEDDLSVFASNILDGYIGSLNWAIVIPSFVAAIIVGILTIRYIRTFIIVTTAVSGGITFSTCLLIDIIGFNNLFVILLVAAAVAVLGAAFQFRTTKKGYHR